MKQDYFVYNGKFYKTGAIFIIKQMDYISARYYEVEATFLYYIPESNRIAIKFDGRTNICPMNIFSRIFVRSADKINETISVDINTECQLKKKRKFTDEFDVDGLFLAWMWYIFIMGIAIIFKDCIGIWIIASIIFFDYRNKKLKEAGYK